MLEKKIEKLKEKLIWDASLVEKMLENSIKGLVEKKKKLLNNIIKREEPQVNLTEIDIDEECISLIALYQPEAKDLRTILMILKINNDIERIGDLAVNISESALFLIEKPDVKPLIDIPRMADVTIKMLRDSMNAFINENSNLAKEVIKRDNIVDELQEQIIRELITFMMADPRTIERALHLIRISHNIERVADLSTNFCEDTIYIIEGKVIKHKKKINGRIKK